MAGADTFYVTTPIYYVNDSPHVGHAYTTVACDALARFWRLDGRETYFLTGTDEHGQKVEKAAQLAGTDPQSFTDNVSGRFRDLAALLHVANDDFIRTTEERHKAGVQALWQRLVDKGEIYLGSYAGWYAVRDEAFYAESELIDGKAPSGAPVEWVAEPSYFFRLSAWGDRLLAFYADNPGFILPPSRRNEVVRFVEGGLQDLSVSRTSFSWGVPVPGDPDHVVYVWLDALANYITALGYPDEAGDRYRTFWPADLHVVGKDILRFHAVFWPAFLMAASLPTPKRVFAHGWWTIEGQKMSKSLGNVIDPRSLIEEYGIDAVRYFLLREVPFGNDGDFSKRAMVGRLNSDLANDYGNLCQRVLSMIGRNCGGEVPMPGAFTDEDRALLDRAHGLLGIVRAEIENQALNRALEAIFEVVGLANRYVDAQAPWTLRKTDSARMATVLYVLAETIRHLAVLTQPVMPDASAKILDLLAQPDDARGFASLGASGQALGPGTALPPPAPIFPRYVETDGAA
ncbi:methionine--tRNA ligase [Marinivivus vitaminiproducens]|uniref:methionine--tRNA ligase n=1 Tax=Marinivivus vitaminiproducens TaxID=3035935 RepID=UPI0027A0AA0E|nr:methionine--tRNA ligase [Geminicoccaceae bacterium SCSIO 64248]